MSNKEPVTDEEVKDDTEIVGVNTSDCLQQNQHSDNKCGVSQENDTTVVSSVANENKNISECCQEKDCLEGNVLTMESIEAEEKNDDTVNCVQTPSMSEKERNSQTEVIATVDESSDDSDSDDSTSDSSDTTSDSSEDETTVAVLESPCELKQQTDNNQTGVTNAFEKMLLENEELIDDSTIVLTAEEKLDIIGKISGVVTKHVIVIKACLEKPAVDLGTAVFALDRAFLGKIYETFGPVSSPYYIVCVKDEGMHESLTVDQEVYYASENSGFTSFVLPSQLSKAKGSDASWLGDNEPPADCVEFSDDEQERSAKRQLKCKRKAGSQQQTGNGNIAIASSKKTDGSYQKQPFRQGYRHRSTVHQNVAAPNNSFVTHTQHMGDAVPFRYSAPGHGPGGFYPPSGPGAERFGMPPRQWQPPFPPHMGPYQPFCHPDMQGMHRMAHPFPPPLNPPNSNLSNLFAKPPSWQN